MEARLVAKDGEIATGEKSLASWKKAHGEEARRVYEKAVAIGNAREAERATLAARVIVLLPAGSRPAHPQRRALPRLVRQALSRYEKFGLGTALTSREPFVGTTRVKFENLVQDYSDQLADQKIKPEDKPQQPPRLSAAPAKTEKPSGKKFAP